MGEFPSKKNQFKKGQSGNPKGRPKKLLSSVVAGLKQEGYEEVKSSQIKDAFELLISLDEEKLKQVALDRQMPMVCRIVAKAVVSKKGFEIIEKILDRVHGKAIQKTKSDDGFNMIHAGVSEERLYEVLEEKRQQRINSMSPKEREAYKKEQQDAKESQ